MRIWLKNPLAVLSENAGGGVVVEGARIVQCLTAGSAARQPRGRGV